ncbi:hypothetical protein KWE57_03820 [Acinetobacter pittii]|uniref:hypothetical protein n=1 Tax=Acinetobacter pittii TaxID=48296 RepID=UPI00355BE47C
MDKPMTFNKWMGKQGNLALVHANCCRIAYEAGQQSQQTKVDELERIIKLRDQQLTEEIALSTKYVGKFDELQKRVDAALKKLDKRRDELWSKWKGQADMQDQGAANAFEEAYWILEQALKGEGQ